MHKVLSVYHLLNILTNKSTRMDVCEFKRCICKFSWKPNSEFMKTSIYPGKKRNLFFRILLIQLNILKYISCLCAWSNLENIFCIVNWMLKKEALGRKLENHSYLQKKKKGKEKHSTS